MVEYVIKGIIKRAISVYIQLKRRMKILIVDDNPRVRELMRTFLKDVTEKFCECDDGTEALASFADFHPDLVLMDWEMKQKDGLTATREIVSIYPEANILLVTQFDDDELKSAAQEAGAKGFILKDDLQSIHQFCITAENRINPEFPGK